MDKLALPRHTLRTKSGRFQTCYAVSSGKLDRSLPVLVMVNSWATSIDLYAPQFHDSALTSKVNLLAIGLLGHETEAKRLTGSDCFTYWDQAELIIDTLDALDIESFFILGTSQGGFIAARVALRAGSRVLGIIACGSTFRDEFSYPKLFSDYCDDFSSGLENFTVPDHFTNWWLEMGWGKSEDRDLMAFWSKSLKDRYNGSEGERRLWLITVTIMERDTLRHRLRDVKCPVWILHGDQDAAIPVSSAQEQAEWFVNVNPADLRLNIIPGGSHYLTQSKPDECRSQILDLLQTYVSRR